MQKTVTVLIAALMFLQISAQVRGEDWIQWRGPNADGVATAEKWNPEAMQENVKFLWKINVGMGHSAVAIMDNKVYTMGNRAGDTDSDFMDIIHCLDKDTGNPIWEYQYPCHEGEDPGPGSTPVIDDDRLYAFGRKGHLHCLEAKTGKVIWKRHLVDEGLAPTHEEWGYASSPVIHENLLLLSVNKSGICFNKMTGKLIWNSPQDKCGFSSPFLFEQNGKILAAIKQDRKCKAVDPETGDIIWDIHYGWGDADPVLYQHNMLINGQSTMLLDISQEKPVEIWKNKEIQWQFQSLSVVDDHAFGFGEIDWEKRTQAFYCVDLKTGVLKWSKNFEMWGASLAAGDHIILITGQGKLNIIKASPEGYREISSIQAVDMAPHDDSKGYRRECHCWTYPVLNDGKLYIRNTWGELVCIDVRE